MENKIQITIHPQRYTHLPEISSYCNNWYKDNESEDLIFEWSDDDCYMEYYLVREGKETYLGGDYFESGMEGHDPIRLVTDGMVLGRMIK